MNRQRILIATTAAALVAMLTVRNDVVEGQAQQNMQVPKFQYDPSFPQPLPETWAIGPIGGMAVDSHDHLWVLHRPGGLVKNERFSGANASPPKADCRHLCRSEGRRLSRGKRGEGRISVSCT